MVENWKKVTLAANVFAALVLAGGIAALILLETSSQEAIEAHPGLLTAALVAGVVGGISLGMQALRWGIKRYPRVTACSLGVGMVGIVAAQVVADSRVEREQKCFELQQYHGPRQAEVNRMIQRDCYGIKVPRGQPETLRGK